MSNLVKKIFQDLEEKSMRLTEEQSRAMRTLELAARKTSTPQGAIGCITEVLTHIGMTAYLSDDPKKGIPLKSDARLQGKYELASLIVEGYDTMTPGNQFFLGQYAESAGLVLDHALMAQKIQESEEERIRLKGMFNHEFRTYLSPIIGMSQLLVNRFDLDSKERGMVQSILRGGNNINDLTGLLTLNGTGIDEMKEFATDINVVELAREKIDYFSSKEIEHPVQVNLQYSIPIEGSIKIFFEKSTFAAMYATVLANAIAWSPGTTVLNGIKIENKDLELVFQNDYGDDVANKRIGLGRGRGLPFVRDSVIGKVGGSITMYEEPIFENKYDHSEVYGKSNENACGIGTFATKLTIPLDALK